MDGVTVTDTNILASGEVTPPGLVPGMRPTDFVQKLSFGAVENCFDRFK